MSKKRILMISQNFYPEIGSAANRMKNIYQLLSAQGYYIKVITTEPSYPNKNIYSDEKFWDENDFNEDPNITRSAVKTRKYSRNIMSRLLFYLEIALKMLLFIIKDKNKYDVVFVTSPAIFIGFVGLFAKYRYKAKLILDIRDLWPDSLSGVGVLNHPVIISVFSKLERILYKAADKITVNSKGFINHILKDNSIREDKITFLPNGARSFELKESGKNVHEAKVIYAGNIGLAQDSAILMELSKKLFEQNIKMDVIGYGMKVGEFAKFVRENKLANVSFIKPSTRKECLDIISRYKVGIVSLNDKEVFDTVLPGKVIDYMTCGVPIVASVSGFSKEIIENENVGFVSSEHSAESMIEDILYLVNNDNVQKLLQSNALNFVSTNLMWEENIWRLVELIEDRVVEREEKVQLNKRNTLDKVESI